jgi:hypothetical protein
MENRMIHPSSIVMAAKGADCNATFSLSSANSEYLGVVSATEAWDGFDGLSLTIVPIGGFLSVLPVIRPPLRLRDLDDELGGRCLIKT